jgi:catechol 2,3-dioxygenase-like lactoylglutathione lyase family enzyme
MHGALERARVAARKFYCSVLGGRQVRPSGIVNADDRLWFLVGGAVIETGPQFRNARARITLDAEAPEDLAVRCWDAGFSVHVLESGSGQPSLALVDPFGRKIDLVPNDPEL